VTELIVCGSAGSFQGVARACSGYLLREGTNVVLLDVGSGSLANIQRWVPLSALQDIFVSHGHHDHVGDIVGLMQYTSFGAHRPDVVRVFANTSTCEVVHQLRRSFAEQDVVVRTTTVSAEQSFGLGGFKAEAFEAWHSRPSLAVRITDQAGHRLAYTGDSALCDELVRCATDADLLVSEASWLSGSGDYPEGVHMTARDAGELARRAGVRRLLITHVWPAFDPYAAAAEAAEVFDGPILVAEDNMVITVRAGS
jgi:ribonuclease BN (tRNA processing enzyme)